MRTPGGYLMVVQPDTPLIERDTFTCCHCNRVVIVKPGSGMQRGWCFMCGKPHCGSKRCSAGCLPFERRLEAWENRNQLRQLF